MAERGLKAALTELLGERALFAFPTARLTTLGVGGPALALARPDTAVELAALLALLRAENVPFMVIGQGSNLLFSDEGYGGVLIQLGPAFQSLELSGGGRLQAGAGAKAAGLLAAALPASLSGLEGLAGIPCSLGGALVMNAGSGGCSISDMLSRVCYMGPDGGRGYIDRDDLRCEYRHLGGLPKGAILLGAEFHLRPVAPEALKSSLAEMAAKRKSSQPQGGRSAGCFFKNPAADSAGRLIDQCGLKGLTIGGAQVSAVHANFFINIGGATANDFLALKDRVAKEVEAKFGHVLEAEVKIIESREESPYA